MNARRGLERLWIVATALWILVVAIYIGALVLRPYVLSEGELMILPALFFGPPMLLLLVGEGAAWVVTGFRSSGVPHLVPIRRLTVAAVVAVLVGTLAGFGIWTYVSTRASSGVNWNKVSATYGDDHTDYTPAIENVVGTARPPTPSN
jgi:hypothetical protein